MEDVKLKETGEQMNLGVINPIKQEQVKMSSVGNIT